MSLSRVVRLKNGANSGKSLLYWMSREQRVGSNFGLSFAQIEAQKSGKKLFVAFALSEGFLSAGFGHYHFMFDGLKKIEARLMELNVPFVLLVGDPATKISEFAKRIHADTIVCDFDPLKIKQQWQKELSLKTDATIYEVDSHNIVPCRVASQKQEFAAYTFRPKIKKLFDQFISQEATLTYHNTNDENDFVQNEFELALQKLPCDKTIAPFEWLKSGEEEAKKSLEDFISQKLDGYAQNRNDPNKDACSNMSIYLHFGHIYSGDIAKSIMASNAPQIDKDAYLEELIVRKELSDNYCFYNPNYDSLDGFPNWVRNSMAEHEQDIREFIYTADEFEMARSHDELWNAAQNELRNTGKMHGYMRMYWAKKILEWTPSLEIAQKLAIYLNDKYALDGRDPNGYTGIAWSIGGVHDRAWFDRPVFGKIRYMNANGAKSKFDVKKYCAKWLP